MILTSLALVVVAVALLAAGVLTEDDALVLGSMVSALAAAVPLLIGVLQGRGASVTAGGDRVAEQFARRSEEAPGRVAATSVATTSDTAPGPPPDRVPTRHPAPGAGRADVPSPAPAIGVAASPNGGRGPDAAQQGGSSPATAPDGFASRPPPTDPGDAEVTVPAAARPVADRDRPPTGRATVVVPNGVARGTDPGDHAERDRPPSGPGSNGRIPPDGSRGDTGTGDTGRDDAASGPTGGRTAADASDPAGDGPEDAYDFEDDPLDEPPAELLLASEERKLARREDEVVVVDGRPRFHLSDCPHLEDRPVERLPVNEAVELGFTPCSRCAVATTLLAVKA